MSWRERKRRLQQQVADFLELPKDIVLDLPKIVIMGNLQIFVENHRGIVEYTPECIRLVTSHGGLCIKGQDLMLRNIMPDEIMVEGKIASLSFDS